MPDRWSVVQTLAASVSGRRCGSASASAAGTTAEAAVGRRLDRSSPASRCGRCCRPGSTTAVRLHRWWGSGDPGRDPCPRSGVHRPGDRRVVQAEVFTLQGVLAEPTQRDALPALVSGAAAPRPDRLTSLRRAGRLGAMIGVSGSFVALAPDLGRPERFVNMLRVAKRTFADVGRNLDPHAVRPAGRVGRRGRTPRIDPGQVVRDRKTH